MKEQNARAMCGPYRVVEDGWDWKIVGYGLNGIAEVFAVCSVKAEADEIVRRLSEYEDLKEQVASLQARVDFLTVLLWESPNRPELVGWTKG